MKIKIKLTTEVYVMTMLCGTDGKSVIENCAIAYAVRRIAPKAIVTYKSEMEGSSAIIKWLGSDDGRFVSFLPYEAARFIRKFDASSPEERIKLDETEYEVDFPDELVNEIGIEEVKDILTKSKTLEIV